MQTLGTIIGALLFVGGVVFVMGGAAGLNMNNQPINAIIVGFSMMLGAWGWYMYLKDESNDT